MTVSIRSPYLEGPGAVWLRGNLHAHTARSDGGIAPQKLIDAYAALGYDFLALSDHDLPADYSGLDPRGMLLVPCSEVSAGGPHLLAVGGRERLDPQADRQEVIDRINAAGALAILCHPNWEEHFDHYPFREELLRLAGYAGIEIFNGAVEGLPGRALATDKWDRLLSAGRRCWGLASDDCHFDGHVGRGWIVVRASERSLEGVLAALRAGSFYASSGVGIEALVVEGPRLRILAPDAEAIAVVGEYGARRAWAERPELVFDASQCASLFFRVECFGRAGRMAWTQPFLLAGPEAERRRELLAERPVLRAGRAKRAPQLAGDLSAPAWSEAGLTTRFLHHVTGEPVKLATELRCLVAGGQLLFSARCEEPALDRLKLNVSADGQSSIWADDGFELFLDVEGLGRRYFHVIVNAAGFVYATERGVPAREAAGLPVEVHAGRDARGWTLAVALALKNLGLEPKPGRRIGFNAVRNRRPEPGGTFAWSFTGGSNHRPERFGWLEL